MNFGDPCPQHDEDDVRMYLASPRTAHIVVTLDFPVGEKVDGGLLKAIRNIVMRILNFIPGLKVSVMG